jgi:hypothetical protein
VATEIFEPLLNPKGWKQLFQAHTKTPKIKGEKKSLSQFSTPRAGSSYFRHKFCNENKNKNKNRSKRSLSQTPLGLVQARFTTFDT